MQEILHKLNDYFLKIINKTNDKKLSLSEEEYTLFKKLYTQFGLLLCHPEDNYYENIDQVQNSIKENDIYIKTYFLKSEECKKKIEENPLLQAFINGEDIDFEQPSEIGIEKNDEYSYNYFKKDENFLYEYSSFNNNKIPTSVTPIQIDRYNRKAIIKVHHPLYIKDIDSIPEEYILEKTDDYIKISALLYKDKIDISQAEKNIRIDNRATKNREIWRRVSFFHVQYYKHPDGKYYSVEQNNNKEALNTYLKMIKIENKILVLDKDKNEIDISNMQVPVLLKQMRHCIAHNKNIYEYALELEETKQPFTGNAFIINDKAILVSRDYFSRISKINYDNLNRERQKFRFYYAPKTEELLNNETVLKTYLGKCKKIEISFDEKISYDKVNAVYDYLIENYNQKENLEKYIKNEFTQVIGNCTVEIKPLENIYLLLKICLDNPSFGEDLEIESQEDYISFLLNTFYSEALTSENILKKNHKPNKISIRAKGIMTLFTFLLDFLESKDESSFDIIKIYISEYYMLMCMCFAYTNLVYNSFDENIDPETSKLSQQERSDLLNKLKPYMFNDFSKRYLNGKKESEPERITTIEDMTTIISTIRNNVAHCSFRVKLSKNGNPENHLLIFQRKSLQKKQNNFNCYYQITCKDFIKFISNNVFASYGKKEKIVVDNFDILLDKVTSKIE